MKSLYFAVPVAMIGASVFMFYQGTAAKKQAEVARSQLTLQQARKQAEAASAADMISARQVIEGLAVQHGLPVVVTLDGRTITVSSKPAPPAAESAASGAPAATSAAEDKERVLANPGRLVEFLSALPTLPYPLSYKSLCIGISCSHAIDIAIAFGDPNAAVDTGKALSAPPSAPAAPAAAPAAAGAPQPAAPPAAH